MRCSWLHGPETDDSPRTPSPRAGVKADRRGCTTGPWVMLAYLSHPPASPGGRMAIHRNGSQVSGSGLRAPAGSQPGVRIAIVTPVMATAWGTPRASNSTRGEGPHLHQRMIDQRRSRRPGRNHGRCGAVSPRPAGWWPPPTGILELRGGGSHIMWQGLMAMRTHRTLVPVKAMGLVRMRGTDRSG